MFSKEQEKLARAECFQRGIDPDEIVDLNATTSEFLQKHGLADRWPEEGHTTLDMMCEGPAWHAFAGRVHFK